MTFVEFAVDLIIKEKLSELDKSKEILAEEIFSRIDKLGLAFAKKSGHIVVPQRCFNDAEKIAIALKERVHNTN